MKMDDFRQLIVTIFTLEYIMFIEIAFQNYVYSVHI